MAWQPPQPPQFPEGTSLFIKDFDVPLAHVPGEGWFNWFGGRSRVYDVIVLKPGNHWPAESLDEWLDVVRASLS